MRFFAQFNNGFITNTGTKNYGQLFSSLEYFGTTQILFPATLGLKIAGGDSYGKIPFYNQFTLGQNLYLRGYRNNRFAGEGFMVFNSELRLLLLKIATSAAPIKIGIKGFFDTGRIVQKGDSEKWHNGYGFGIYLIPLDRRFTFSASAAFSDEETMFLNFTLGAAFK